jgi:hypothetical protein
MQVSGSIGEIFSFDLLEQTLGQSPAETFTSPSAVQPL